MSKLRARSLCTSARFSRGISLIELMVAITVGLIISGAMLGILMTASKSNSDLARSGQVSESGRFTIQMVAAEVVQAGFWAGWIPKFDDLSASGVPDDFPKDNNPSDTTTGTTAVPDPCKAYINWSDQYKRNLIGIPIQVYSLVNGVSPVCDSVVTNPVADSDILIIRRVESCAAGSTGCTATSSGDVFVQQSLCDRQAPRISNSINQLNFTKRDCATVSDRFRFISTIFYVRSYSVTPGDGVPTLMMSQFGLVGSTPQQKPAEAMIPGVQALRVDLGIDNLSKTGVAVDQQAAISWADPTDLRTPVNRGDGNADSWIRCSPSCSASELVNVVAVRLNVLSRAENKTQGYTDLKTYTLSPLVPSLSFSDGFVRRVFSQTIRVNNVSMRRELPSG